MRKLFLIFTLISISLNAQKIEAAEGYSPQIGVLVSMLEDLRQRITSNV